MAVVFSFVAILLGVSFLSFAVNLHHRVSEEIRWKKATYDAYTGFFEGFADFISGRRERGALREFYGDENNKEYIGYRFEERGSHGVEYGYANDITITGFGMSEYGDGEKYREISGIYNYETYADYLYITDKERDASRHDIIRFWTPDTLDGKVHSNDTIHIQQSADEPRFIKRVTTTRNYIEYPNNDADFDEGWGFRSAIEFPDVAQELRNNAGLVLGTAGLPDDSLIHMVLNGNTIRWRKCGLFEVNGVDSLRCFPTTIAASALEYIPTSGVVFVYGKLWLSAARGRGDRMDGEFPERIANINSPFVSEGFEGMLTIGCSDTMIITDLLVYKHARTNFSVPASMDSCPDVLGLVSERFIMVHRQCPTVMYINAAMAAIRGSISVQDIYWYTAPRWLNPKQSLQIYGSLAQRNRGIVHTTYPCNSDQCERGFDEKDYHYDTRLQENPPPFFMPALDNSIIFMEGYWDGGGG
jgi:hypothetical protein